MPLICVKIDCSDDMCGGCYHLDRGKKGWPPACSLFGTALRKRGESPKRAKACLAAEERYSMVSGALRAVAAERGVV